VVVGNDLETLLESATPPLSSRVSAARRLRDTLLDCGPLSGLVAALRDCQSEWALALAVDLPLLTEYEVRLLLEQRHGARPVLSLTADGQLEPLAALYRSRSCRPVFERHLESGRLKPAAAIAELGWLPIRLPPGSRALLNVNTPEDVRRLTDEA
jgi:molybdenum cofactor guanylyltransferase